ncbi:MAG: tRNA (adenosine(37)-N6)-threonylcarbamoyltransferase complex transferase subunit TsaD [Flavobacteriales bacterium]|nr:tRNA (adenosine(37)-N6)-threonylcarbamoyltransferase complex transferase subunit TsaD [Flavobacteriales bacterium]
MTNDNLQPIILGIESSCDDTSAAIVRGTHLLSSAIASQKVHELWGGVVPELASRAHQQNIVPVVDAAFKQANIRKEDVNAIAFTRGPGLMGSLLVGTSFAKSMAIALNVPLIEVNHMQGHILANFVDEKGDEKKPEFPFLCLTVSGGHTQIVRVDGYFSMTVLGQTIDDAAGEAFDKIGKVLSLPYPAGPHIDAKAKVGNKDAFVFSRPDVKGLDFSFSGLKTNVLYFIEKKVRENPDFIAENMDDICASVQYTIIDILLRKLKKAIKETGITSVAIAGGVSANSGLRCALTEMAEKQHLTLHLPSLKFTTDNAAMIAVTGYFKYLKNDFTDATVMASARYSL